MRKRIRSPFPPRNLLWMGGCLAVTLVSGPLMRAQDTTTSLSPGVGASLYNSDQTEGLDSTFDASTSNLTNPELHTDISDPLHGSLLSSGLSPVPWVQPWSNSPGTVNADVVSQADAGAGQNALAASGQRSRTFYPGAESIGGAGAAGFQGARQAFSGSISREELGGVRVGPQGFAGRTVESPTDVSAEQVLGVLPSDRSRSSTGTIAQYRGTDPVLSGSIAGDEGDLELGGDMPAPTTQTSTFFAEPESPGSGNFAFDDGQTPLSGFHSFAPGSVIESPPEYSAAVNGFPDSTQGTAGLPLEASESRSPFPDLNVTSSPFAPVSEGTVFGVHTGVSYSLHGVPLPPPAPSFHTVERRLQEQRLLAGVPISVAQEAYQKDLREYQEHGTRRERRSTLTPPGPNPQ